MELGKLDRTLRLIKIHISFALLILLFLYYLFFHLLVALRQSYRLQHKSGTDDAALSSTVGHNLAPMACLLSHTGAPGDVTDEVT